MEAIRLVKARTFAPTTLDTVVVRPEGTALTAPRVGAICGSDKPFFLRGPDPDLPPGSPLHEIVACIVDADDPDLVGGRAITVLPDGAGMRQRLLVPERYLYPITTPVSELPDDEALLIQPLSTVLAGLDRLGGVEGCSVLILGLGPIGALFAEAVRRGGARSVSGVDPRTRVADHAHLDRVVSSVCELEGEFDVCIEAVGHQPGTLAQAVDFTAPWGRILAFGIPDQACYDFPIDLFTRKRLTLTSCVQPDWLHWLGEAERFLTDPQHKRPQLITHHFGVEDVQLAFDTATDRGSDALKVVIDFAAWQPARPREATA